MILTGVAIQEAVERGDIKISPFKPENICPNSYDVHIGGRMLLVDAAIIDPERPQSTRELALESHNVGDDPDKPSNAWLLRPGELYLSATQEIVGSERYVPQLHGRSSIGRCGIQVHITAGLGDLGFFADWTLEITVVRPTYIKPGMRIAQFTFHEVAGLRTIQYSGRYANQTGPTPSRFDIVQR